MRTIARWLARAGRATTKLFYGFFARAQLVSYGKSCHFNSYCRFGAPTRLGDDCHFNGLRTSGAGSLLIGSHFHSGRDIVVFTATHNFKSDKVLPYSPEYIIGNVVIGDYVWLGERVLILPGVTVGDFAIVGAGSVVTKSVGQGEIVAGSPARLIGKRDPALVQSALLNMKASECHSE